ncbi:MAG: alanine--tRNA ligase [Candidatus Aenigmarchaeota archaeon]|nr:alanine--tRNA ligase [Candidatus Aenigmarchaeota archaeon]
MNAKDALRKKFSEDPYRYYHVKLFDELGFKRRQCKCGRFFWTLSDRQNCPDSSCTPYGFIGNPPSNKKTDYIRLWKDIEKFFVKNGHESIPSYPTVCRWFPGLYFNIASIVSFQRSVGGNTVFEFPANPLIIPQVCLRFNDIPNVGVSGRHQTSFTMIGQHSVYDEKSPKQGYWKDHCIELDWQMLTNVMKIPAEEISFLEDVWLGPAAFGYSLEYFARGLELGNAVFTEFVGTPEQYKQMDKKVIDMGAGYERFVWLLAGTHTSYDAVFGPVIAKLKKKTEYDDIVFNSYSRISSMLNADEYNIELQRKIIEKQLGLGYTELRKRIEQLEAVYAIADHAKTLLYAITDGQLPSNVGGGYNLRVILRRALGFINNFKLDIDLFEVCKMHAKYLKPFDKRLIKNLDDLESILGIEAKRFAETRARSEKIIEKLLAKQIDNDQLVEAYESNGITPEMIVSVAESLGQKITIPADIYTKLSEKHVLEKKEEKQIDVPFSQALYHENQNILEFEAKVIKISCHDVVLDKTYFYGRSGGQEPDHGTINGCMVYDAEKTGSTVVHRVEGITFTEGDVVKCIINKERRNQLMLHHTGTHVLNAAAKQVLGNHVWQHSAFKDIERARLDITHYELLDDKKLDEIERIANNAIKSGYSVKKSFVKRTDAEKLFGFTIYQGGAVPEQMLRIIEIMDKNKIFDVEACGGIHVDNTKELKKLIVLKQERIQDGVIRLIFACGPAADTELEKQRNLLKQCAKILNVSENYVLKEAKELVKKWKILNKTYEKHKELGAENMIDELRKRFAGNVLIEPVMNADMKDLQNMCKMLSGNEKIIILFGICENISIFASSGDQKAHAGAIVSNAAKELGGRGGGSPVLGQGIGADKEKLDHIIEKLKHKYQKEKSF